LLHLEVSGSQAAGNARLAVVQPRLHFAENPWVNGLCGALSGPDEKPEKSRSYIKQPAAMLDKEY
jgi:hypothetical protein